MICSKCKIDKNLEFFGKRVNTKHGYSKVCKSCINEYNVFIYKNSPTRKEYAKAYNKKNYNTEDRKKVNSEYYIQNKTKINTQKGIRDKKRRLVDNMFRLSGNIRKLIRVSLKNNNFIKRQRTNLILGCSYEEFKIYLESKFESWMSWDNWGLYNGELNYGWDIDHIIPSSSATTEEEILKLNHFTNLQPLCSKTNREIKRNLL